MATAIVVALASATYALFDLSARAAERRIGLEREARTLTSTLRVSLEREAAIEARDARFRADQLQQAIDALEKKLTESVPGGPTIDRAEILREEQQLKARLAAERAAAGLARPVDQALAYRGPSDAQLRDLSRASGSWRVTVITRAHTEDADLSESQLRRFRTLLEVPQLTFADVEDDQYYFDQPLHVSSGHDEDQVVLGMLEISKPAATLEATSNDLTRAIILVVLIVAGDHGDGRRAREPVRQSPDHQATARDRRRRQGRPLARDPVRARRRDRSDRDAVQ